MQSDPVPLSPEWDLESYSYDLPPELIAQHPADRRDQSRMLTVDRETGALGHRRFHEIVDLLPEDAALVVNNTRVVPARLPGTRPTGGQIEALLLEERGEGLWKAAVRRAKRVKSGEELLFCDGAIPARAKRRTRDGHWLLEFAEPGTLLERLDRHALAPLPPYIERREFHREEAERDRERYQTCFAKQRGAVAAPTAGLHFTPEVVEALRARDIPVVEVTLHVGLGTFNPIRGRDVREHPIHTEHFEITPQNKRQLEIHHREGRRVVAVGTTSARVLETLALPEHRESLSGSTNIYIYPPHRFHYTQGLLTNFHLPGSTLLLLVSAFWDRERLLAAYAEAVRERYRFFSYGDCMLLL